MAITTQSALETGATTIRNETAPAANTASRIGQWMLDLVQTMYSALGGKLDAPTGGSAGQVLAKTAGGTQWSSVTALTVPTPTYAATLNIDAGAAAGAVCGPINLTGDITSLSATLADGAMLEVLFTAVSASRQVTIAAGWQPIALGAAPFMAVPPNATRRALLERKGSTTFYAFI